MSELRFEGKVAIVTGGGRGLGAAQAKLLASRGAKVVVNDLGTSLTGEGHDPLPAATQVEEIIAAGGMAVANFDDVRSAEGASNLVRQAITTFGAVHIVVNSAGNFLPECSLIETTTERFDSLWKVHVLGSVNVVRAAWPHFVSQRYGRVINMGSHSGYLGNAGRYEYCTVKSALHGFTRTLAIEGAEHNITANLASPGALTRNVALGGAAQLLPKELSGPAFTAELASQCIVWLAHEDCKVSGESYVSMAGTTSRIVVVETAGYFDRVVTPETLRDQFACVQDMGDLTGSRLTVPPSVDVKKPGAARAAELINTYLGRTPSGE